MTREDIAKLSDEDVNIEIAELCGWHLEISPGTTRNAGLIGAGLKNAKGEAWGFLWIKQGDTIRQHPYGLPSYCACLNAMRSCVMDLSIIERRKFQYELKTTAEDRKICFCELSSRDWAEAFLFTMQDQGSGVCTQPRPSDDGSKKKENV